jgi:gliding motility-associated-like protein
MMKSFYTRTTLKMLFISLTVFIFILHENDAQACHALPIVNFSVTPVQGGINVNGSSNSATCGCTNIFWMDIEVRCVGQAFDGAPFNPGFWGPLTTYPYFQSAQMNKPGCQLVAYPTTFIPYTSMCPGMNYNVRARENHNGQVGTWSTPIAFTVPGTTSPIVASASGANLNICQGDCTTLTADVIGGCGLAPLYAWSTGQNTQSINVCPTTTTTYTVTITEQCSGFSDQASVTVNVLPPSDPGTASASSLLVCDGETVDLNLVGHGGNVQWQSAPNSGGPWTNIGGVNAVPFTTPPINATTCYRAQVSGCGPAQFSNIVCVEMAPLPILTVSNETICEGQSTTLTSNVNLPGGIYSWSPSGQTTADLINVSPNTTTTYELTYDLNGCVVNAQGTVTVLPQPTTLNLTNQTICAGDNAVITANPDVPGGNFTWTPNVSTTNTATVSPPVGTTTYTILYGVSGCEITETVDVTVNDVPTIAIEDANICAGDQATLTAIVNMTGGNFTWTPTGATSNSITESPANTTTYTVNYDVNGCSNTAQGTIFVHEIPVAGFNFTNVCDGLALNMNSTSTVGGGSSITSTQWDINSNGTIDYTTNNISHTYGTHGTYNVTLFVETNQGCTDQITQAVEVFPNPVIAWTSTPLCLGNPTDFTDNTTVPGGGNIANWSWNFDDGNTSTQQNPQHLYANPGFYDVVLTVTTDNGCTASQMNQIEIYGNPTAAFQIGHDCYYNAINFTNQSTANATLITWDFGDGNTSTQGNPSHQYNSPGAYNVTIFISTIDGCADTLTQTAYAYAQPQPAFTVNQQCLGTASTFANQSTIANVDGDQITNWDWNFGDGNSSTANAPVHNYQQDGVYTVTLTTTSNFGCTNSITGTAEVYPLPQVNFSPTDVCLDFATQFTDLSTVTSGNTTNNIINWNWDFGNGATSNQQNPVHIYNQSGTFNATLTVTTNNGCTGSATNVVTVYPKPLAAFLGDSLEGCSPVCFNVSSTALVNNPSYIESWEWQLTNGQTYTGTSIQDCFINNTANAISLGLSLTVTTNHGCVDTHFEPNYINLYHNPIADFNYFPDQPNVINSEVAFTNTSINGDMFIWTVPEVGNSTQANPTFAFPNDAPGTYEVTLVARTNEGCTDTVSTLIRVEDQVVFYIPNAFTPDFDDYNQTFQPVFTAGFDPYDYHLTIYNRWGEIIFESYNATVGWDGTYGASSNEIVKDGTYIWTIAFREATTDRRHFQKGHVTLIR